MNNEIKAALTLGVVFALCAAVVVWITGGKEVHAAIVSGCFTVFAFMGAAYVAIWQLREQRKNTEASNRQSEALKLKKEIYEEVWRKTDQAMAALKALYTHLSDIEEVAIWHLEREVQMLGGTLKRQEFEKRTKAANESCLELNRLAETWGVADGRLRLFTVAFMKLHEISTEIERDYRGDTVKPIEAEDYVGASMSPYPPGTPDDEALQDFVEMIERWLDAIDIWESFIDDYQRVMQQVLLSELFPLHLEQTTFKQCKRRRIRRMTLDSYEELIEGFKEDELRDQLFKLYQRRRAARLGRKEDESVSKLWLSTP